MMDGVITGFLLGYVYATFTSPLWVRFVDWVIEKWDED